MTPRSIGLVFAHPDDETFCVGGIVAKYAAQGIPVHLFCATNGDAGKSASVPVSSREELSELRRAETRAAANILGITSVEFGGYPDGQLQDADATRLIGDIVSFVRRHRPTVLIGFGPEGAPTGHRDHRAASRATIAAFFLSGLASAYREQSLAPHRVDRLYFHAWAPVADPAVDIESVPSTCAIDVRAFKEAKVKAFAAHRTQQGSARAFYDLALKDAEHLALASGIPQAVPIVDDLFAGLAPQDQAG